MSLSDEPLLRHDMNEWYNIEQKENILFVLRRAAPQSLRTMNVVSGSCLICTRAVHICQLKILYMWINEHNSFLLKFFKCQFWGTIRLRIRDNIKYIIICSTFI